MSRTVDDLKVGDVVHWSDVNRKGLSSGAVTHVGRKLIRIGLLTFRKDTMRTNDGYSHKMLVPDVDAYNERKARANLLTEIRNNAHNSPASLTDVRAAANLLGIKERISHG